MDPEPNPLAPTKAHTIAATSGDVPPGALICQAGETIRLPAPPFAAAGTACHWEQITGPAAEPEDRSRPDLLVNVPLGLVNSKLTFEAAPASGQAPVHSVTLWVDPDPDSPIAEAGPIQVVEEGELILLDGRGTRLPSGWSARDVVWEWVQVSGPSVALSDPWSLTPVLRAPEGLVTSDVRLELRVSNGLEDGAQSISTINLLVCSMEDALAIESKTAANAPAGDLVFLKAHVENHLDQPLHWDWRQVSGPPVHLKQALSSSPCFDAPFAWRNVTLGFEVKVHDGLRAGRTEVELMIEPDEQAVRIEIQSLPEVAEGDLVCIHAELSGEEPEAWNTRWIQLEGPPVQLLTDPHDTCTNANSRLSFVAPDVASARIGLACIATRDHMRAIDTVQISIEGDEDALHVDAGSTQRARAAAEIHLTGSASEIEGRSVRVLWRQIRGPRVALSDPTSLCTNFTAPSRTNSASDLSAPLQFALHAFWDGLEAIDTVCVHIGEVDALSPSRTGNCLEVGAGERIQLGTWSESELAGLEECTWRQVGGPLVQLENEKAPLPWLHAPLGYANTRLTFELDALIDGERSLDTLEVLVEPDDDAPVAICATDYRASARELVRLSAFTRDPNGLSFDARWRQTSGPKVELDDASAMRPTFSAPALGRAETLSFEFTVTDGVESVAETVQVHVAAADSKGAASPTLADADQDMLRAG